MVTVKEAGKAGVLREVRRSLQELLQSLGIDMSVVRFERAVQVEGSAVDFVAVLEGSSPQSKKALLGMAWTARGEPFYLSQLIARLKSLDLGPLRRKHGVGPGWFETAVVAPYVSDLGRRLCIENRVGHLDLAGNCHLRIGPRVFDRSGRENPRHEKRVARSVFSPKGIRIVRALLEEPKRAWKLVELAHSTGVSLGRVHAVRVKLEQDGFAGRDKDQKVVLERPGDLLDRWASVTASPMGEDCSYVSLEPTTETLAKRIAELGRKRKLEYALTRHAGAAFVAPFVRYTDTHFYVRLQDVPEWVRALELRPAEFGGAVHLIAAADDGVFYRKQKIGGVAVACDTQLYVDLYNYPARGREQADFLRERKIRF